MPLTTFRIVKSTRASTAFDGEGARLYGGRWNSVGTRMLYTSENRSLAALEILVHLQGPALGYSLIQCEIPDDARIESLSDPDLPEDWRTEPAPTALARLGDAWTIELRSLALRVPSAVVEGEYNVLLNPAHPDFARIVIHDAVPFRYDPRLERRTSPR